MKRSNLTWHIQGNLPSEIAQIIAGSGAEFYKKMDPPDTDPFPGKKCIGRTYMDDQPSWDLVAQGAIGAEKWYNHWALFYESRSYVHAWEGPNEPPVAYLDQRLALNAFTVRFADIMHHIARPKPVVGINSSRGCPDVLAIVDLREAIRACDYWGIHEYGTPTMDTEATWHCLRYRRFMEVLKLPTPKAIIIGECGIDDGAKHGWKTFAKTESEFMRQLAWYDAETLQDPYVKALCVFTAAPSGWDDFEVNETLSRMMAERIAHAPVVETPVVVTPTPPPISAPAALIAPRLHWPVLGHAWVSQAFGEHDRDYSAYLLIGHNGIDIPAPLGTPVEASHDGQVWAYDESPRGYGKIIEIWAPAVAGGVYKTIYAHLSAFAVENRAMVTTGQIIGKVGNTGNSDGSHLHWSLKLLKGKNPGYRDFVDASPHYK